jgi:ubiquitin-like-conjugating enzyme ATG3
MQFLRNTREYFTPVLSQSAFLERGVLTPEEFVKACDNFVTCFPSWKWASGDPKGLCSYLPKNKQFIITRGVPSYHRVSQTEKLTISENTIENDWQGATIYDADDQQQNIPVHNNSQIRDDIDNLENFDECAIIKCRRYDVSITYDKYYQTPRCWLIGYNEEGNLLTTDELFMDIIKDYADKTVTIELHPHLFTPHIYIHPCRHAQVMKNMLENIIQHGGNPQVEQYMLIFVKFIQSVIPTIEYDYTCDFTV